MPRALITGVTGQDGSYLAEQLLEDGYNVYGIVRRTSTDNRERLTDILDHENYIEVEADLADQSSLSRAVKMSDPDEIYNLAAQSFVGVSWDQPEVTSDITGLGTLRILEAARIHAPNARFYQASSSEMFGNQAVSKSGTIALNELSPLHPRSPYGVAKVFAHEMARVYKESYGMHVSCGILFNHESPRRGEEFITRKITKAVAAIKKGTQHKLALGNLDSARDWGFAGDYVRAMRLMVQQEQPGDYVIATGETHTIREFLEIAFSHVGLKWKDYVVQDKRFMRPAEIDVLIGDATLARQQLNWKPEVTFEGLVKMMVDADIKQLIC